MSHGGAAVAPSGSQDQDARPGPRYLASRSLVRGRSRQSNRLAKKAGEVRPGVHGHSQGLARLV